MSALTYNRHPCNGSFFSSRDNPNRPIDASAQETIRNKNISTIRRGNTNIVISVVYIRKNIISFIESSQSTKNVFTKMTSPTSVISNLCTNGFRICVTLPPRPPPAPQPSSADACFDCAVLFSPFEHILLCFVWNSSTKKCLTKKQTMVSRERTHAWWLVDK